MWWMYTGFVAAFYLALAVWAAVDLPSHPFPAEGAKAFFLFIPLLVVAFSAEGVATAFDEQKVLRTAIKIGALTRRHAFAAGLVAGALGVAAVVGTWHIADAISNSLGSVMVALVLIGFELLVFPAFGAGYLLETAKSRLTKHCTGPGPERSL